MARRYWFAPAGEKPDWLHGPKPIKGTPGFLVFMAGVLGMVMATTSLTPILTDVLFGWNAGSRVVRMALGLPGLLLVGFWFWAIRYKCAPRGEFVYDATGTFVSEREASNGQDH
jgi:hypothetical protein